MELDTHAKKINPPPIMFFGGVGGARYDLLVHSILVSIEPGISIFVVKYFSDFFCEVRSQQ